MKKTKVKKNVTMSKSKKTTARSRQAPKRGASQNSQKIRAKLNAQNSKSGTRRIKSAKGSKNKKTSNYSKKELERDLLKDFEAELKQSEIEESENAQEIYEELLKLSREDKKAGKVLKQNKTFFSQSRELNYDVRIYRIKFKDSEIITFPELKSMDSNDLFNQLEPYFTKIYSKIRKHPLYFSTKILVISGNEFDAVSHSKRDVEAMPDEFYTELRTLCENVIKWIVQYEKRGLDTTIIGIEFQVYDKEYKPKKKGKKK